MIQKWKTLSRKEVLKNPYWTAYQDVFEKADGKQGEYHHINYPGGVEIIAQRSDGRIILVEQYRYLYDQNVLSFPGGSVQPGSNPEQTAHLELLEETGYRAESMKFLGERFIAPGLFHYIDSFYLASDLTLESPRPEATEEFIYYYKTPTEIDEMMARGEIMSGNATCAWTLARPYFFEDTHEFSKR